MSTLSLSLLLSLARVRAGGYPETWDSLRKDSDTLNVNGNKNSSNYNSTLQKKKEKKVTEGCAIKILHKRSCLSVFNSPEQGSLL